VHLKKGKKKKKEKKREKKSKKKRRKAPSLGCPHDLLQYSGNVAGLIPAVLLREQSAYFGAPAGD